MKVAITGATGHLGGLVIRELLNRNHKVKALIRGTTTQIFDGLSIEFVHGDLENQDALFALMESCDALIHSAALISIHGGQGGRVQKTNVEGTRNVMEAAKKAGIKRVIHVSSIHAYQQKPVFEMLDEQREIVNQGFVYDLSKKLGQEIALSYACDAMEVLVVNPTSIIGPFDHKPSKMGKAIIHMCTGRLPYVFKGGFDFCDGRDVASAIVHALDLGRSGEAYLLNGKWYSLKEVASLLSTVSGQKIKMLTISIWIGWMNLPFLRAYAWLTKEEPLYTDEALVAISDGNQNISSAKAEKELNYKKRPLQETLRDTYEWFFKNGYLG